MTQPALSREELERSLLELDALDFGSLRLLSKRLCQSGIQDKAQVDALRSQVSALSNQLQAIPALYAQQSSIQREQHEAELESLRREARMLARKLFICSSQNGQAFHYLEEGPMMGNDYAPEAMAQLQRAVETPMQKDNRELLSERNYLEYRLLHAQAQCARSERELKRMRGHLLAAAPIIIEENAADEPSSDPKVHTVPSILGKAFAPDPARQPHQNKHRPTRRGPVMADAEAEHLLLAGKTLEQVRRVLRTVAVPQSNKRKVKEKGGQGEAEEARDPGLTGLLQAAHSLGPEQLQPAKKRKLQPRPSQALPATQPGEPESSSQPEASTSKSSLGSHMSALDVLADQAASQQSGPPKSDGQTAAVPGRTDGSPPVTSYAPFPSHEDHPASGWPKTTGGPHAGLAPYTEHQGHLPASWPSCFPSAAPPFGNPGSAKWTVQEDEQLVKAIVEHGENWQLVSQQVPSRQVGQIKLRWTRALKKGEALPPHLQQYMPIFEPAHEPAAPRRRSAVNYSDFMAEGEMSDGEMGQGSDSGRGSDSAYAPSP